MTKWALCLVIAAVLVTGTFAFMPVEEASSSGAENELVGIPTGNMMLRGIPGPPLPWAIAESKVKFDDNNRIEVKVEGLVISGPGFNPVREFFATLSCIDASGATVNINTSTVPATTPGGDAKIKDVLTGVPSPCLAPVILVRGDLSTVPGNPLGNPSGPDPLDTWLAASGF